MEGERMMRHLSNGVVRLQNCLQSTGEEEVQRVLWSMLESEAGAEKLCRDLGLPRVTNVSREVILSRGRADFVLAHEDGSVSIVEVKRGGDQRRVVSGIGQLSLYAVQMAGKHGVTIRRVLAWDFQGGSLEEERAICDACEDAGVIPLPLGRMEDHREGIRDALNSRVTA